MTKNLLIVGGFGIVAGAIITAIAMKPKPQSKLATVMDNSIIKLIGFIVAIAGVIISLIALFI